MKGICFIEPLFHKVVKGQKTQTRRMIIPQPDFFDDGLPYCETDFRIKSKSHINEDGEHFFKLNPKYKLGEIVYLKEPYVAYTEEYQELKNNFIGLKTAYKYGNHLSIQEIVGNDSAKWKNKLFMPESAARYFIKITGVKAERLQDISDEDCSKEGIECFTKDNRVFKFGLDGWEWSDMPRSPKDAYASLIDKINGKGTWDKNPYVWVYDFELTNK